MGLLDKIGRVIRSNVAAAVSAAEDPEKMLDQTVVEMQEDYVKLKLAVSTAIASQKRLEQQFNQAQTQADEWYRRAQVALKKGDETLAREALARKQTITVTATSLKQQLDQSTSQVETMRKGLIGLESKIAEAKTKKDMLKARARAAQATEKITEAMGQVNLDSATGTFDRMEEKVLELEARSAAASELAGDSLADKFVALEAGSDLDGDLDALKIEMGMAPTSLPGASTAAGSLPAGKEPAAVDALDAEFEELKKTQTN
jgi:phage shock protein A